MVIVGRANHGPIYLPLSSETTRTRILMNLKGKSYECIDEVKESWEYSSWKGGSRPYTNLFVASVKDIIFWKFECTLGKKFFIGSAI